jgi:SAM-dependent methyltransferase
MKPRRLKIWKNGRIIYYSRKADAKFWDSLWESQISLEYYRKCENGIADEYYPYFEKYLSRDDRILEAGCGTARYVVALRARGYQHINGIDWGKQTINKVKTIYPDLPIAFGDATKVDVGNDFYDGYISLGVVEHREEGPEPFLTEAYRILKPGGYAFFSVPYINPLRNIKRKLGYYHRKNLTGLSFYQYAFNKTDFKNYLEKAGFHLVKIQGVAGIFGLKEELPLLALVLNGIPGGWRIESFLKKIRWFDFFGHMVLFVCKK